MEALDVAPIAPEPGVPVPIRYRDPYLAVIAKPAGIVVHPTASRRSGTLVNRLLEMGMPLAPAGRTAPSRDRPPVGRRDERAHGHRVDRRGVRGAPPDVPAITRSIAATSRSSAARRPTTPSRWTRRWAGAPRGSSSTASRDVWRPRPSSRSSNERMTSRSSKPSPEPAGPIRSGSTSPPSATRSSATGRYGGTGDRSRGGSGLTRPFLHSARIGFPPSDRRRRRSRSTEPLPAISPRRGTTPAATSDLDGHGSRAYLRVPSNDRRVSCPHRAGTCGQPGWKASDRVDVRTGFRPPPRALRVLAARRRGTDRAPAGPTRVPRRSSPRPSVTGCRRSPSRTTAPCTGRSASTRARVGRASGPSSGSRPTSPRVPVRPHPRRERGEVPPPDAARPGRRRLPQPAAARIARPPRGLLPPAADGQAAARRAQRGRHLPVRVPVLRDRCPAPRRSARARARDGGGVPRHLRARPATSSRSRITGWRTSVASSAAAGRDRGIGGGPASSRRTTCTTRCARTRSRTTSCCASNSRSSSRTRSGCGSTPRSSS